MADHLMTIDRNTYESLQKELQELRQKVRDGEKKPSEEQMRLFIEYTPAAIAVFDREMRYLLASRRWRKDYGLGNQDIIGRSYYELFPAISPFWQDIHQRCLSGKIEQCDEDAFIRADGTTDWVKWEIHPWYDSPGQVGGMIMFTEVITTRKQAQIALANSERRLGDIASNLPGAIFQLTNCDDVWRVDYISHFIRELAGITAIEMMEDVSCFFDLIHPEDLATAMASLASAVKNATPWHYEGRLVKPSGEIRWWQADASPTKHHQGDVTFCGVLLDITERKQAEAELKQLNEELEARVEERTKALLASEARLQRLADNVPGMLYELHLLPDSTMFFHYVSSGCREIYGRTAKELQNDASITFADIHPEDVSHVQAAMAQSAQTLQKFEYEWRIITTSGEHKWVKAFSKPERHAGGEVVWYGYLLDITERKQAEIQLQQQTENLEKTLLELQLTQTQLIQSEKMSSLGNMVAGVAHEINNPVNFIHGNIIPATEYAQDLLRLVELYQIHYPYAPEEIKETLIDIDFDFLKEDLVKILTSMRIGTQRIREIVLSLRNFSRLDEAEFKNADIHDGINSTLMILQNRLKAKPENPEILVIKEYGKLPLIECYPGQLNQVFMNIISNAIDALEDSFTGKQGEIKIRTEVINNNWVSITITDNGMGIPATVIPKLFDPFFTTKSVGKGTGLGLSISYQIVVDRHGGKLSCHSEPGKGAEFVIEIPIMQTEDEKPHEKPGFF